MTSSRMRLQSDSLAAPTVISITVAIAVSGIAGAPARTLNEVLALPDKID
jgi:hypothetical protein